MVKMGKKPLIFMLVLVIFLISIGLNISHADSEDEEEPEKDYIFDEWVKEGESFNVNGKDYLVAAGETMQSAIIMGPTGVYVIDSTNCITIGKLRFCLEDFKYSVGGDIIVHGSDTQEFYITVYEPGAIMSIDRDISSSNMLVGESAEVTIELINTGDEAATGMTYTEEVPSEFEITNTYSLEQYGNKLVWKGAMPANSKKTMSYNIKAKARYNQVVVATLTYKSGTAMKETTNSLGFKANALFTLNFNADKFEIETGEENRFYVTLKNSKDTESTFDLVIIVPENLEIAASHINTTSGNNLTWSGSLEGGEDKSFTTAVKSLSPGIAAIKATANDIADPSNPITKYFNITVLSNEPGIYFIHNDIFSKNYSEIKVYLKNPNTYVSIKDIDITVESPFFNKTAHANEFKPKEYNQILSAAFTPDEPGKLNVKAEVTYKIGDSTFKKTKEEAIEVKDKNAAEAKPEEPVNQTEQPANETAGNESVNMTEGEAEEEAEPGFFANVLDSVASFFGRIKDIVIFWK